METLKRRLISIPAAIILLPVFVVLAPAAVVVGGLRDALSKHHGLPAVRLWFYAIAWLALEWVAVITAAVLSCLWAVNRDLGLRGYHRIQAWWANAHLFCARHLLRVRIDSQDPATIPAGTVIVASRHASPIDAIIPAWLFARQLDRPVHYTMKKELRWMPSIDLFNQKLGNYFVTRGGDTEKEAAAITNFVEAARPESGLVIFPEGTYSTGPVRDRVRKSLRDKGETELANLADDLQHLLPPKIAGFNAYLDAAPEASVLMLGHHGLEGVAELSSLRHALPLTEDVLVRWWTIPRALVPSDPKERSLWLNEQWRRLDSWVESCRKGDGAI